LLEMPFCNAQSFQVFMDEFSKQNPDEFKIMVLDNGAFHKAKSLNIPSNIYLIFLPPYSPELNPAEKMWSIIKRNFTNQLFKDLEQIGKFISDTIKTLTPKQIIKTCNYEYAFVSEIWTI
jgi:transposase